MMGLLDLLFGKKRKARRRKTAVSRTTARGTSWEIYGRAGNRKSYIKRSGRSFARVWEIHQGRRYDWSVFVGHGDNLVAKGKSSCLSSAKAAATDALKRHS